ncbi:MAG TPA: Xaa-Pro dipeptidase [Steroidobacteraceae bacterium]|jgi:Xaa-Pro dipeptidase|nr:Xaa-Pro dipeptidase [Steroidobacteraceae bacterium]
MSGVGIEASREEAVELERLFGPHLATVCARTARALEACGYQGLLVHSGTPLTVFEDDRTYPFEPHAPFKVWAPLADAPDSYIWFEPGAPPRLILRQPHDYWYKSAELPRGYWVRHFDLAVAADVAAARAALPRDLGQAAYLGDAPGEAAAWGPAAVNPRELIRRLDFERAAKTPYELACLRAANRLGARGHLAARRAFETGGSEFDIELAFLAACGLREQELPYNPIIALNEGAAVLHYQVLSREPPRERSSLLIDAGAEFAGYASDITRTYAAEDGDFRALIHRMDALQQCLVAEVRAGVDWRDVHLRAHALTGELLRDAGIARCSADEAVASGVTRVFLPHGIGHLLGLEVHDVGGFMSGPADGEIPRPQGHPHLRLTRVLEPGFVVTMEPGIYFIPQLLEAARADERSRRIDWSRVEALTRFGGIRIEDDLAVTHEGCENLTRDAFRAVGA